jgi:hypothetical protein
MTIPGAEDRERMVLRVPPDVKRQMQKLAIDADMPLQEYATQVFQDHIAAKGGFIGATAHTPSRRSGK